jgi:copper homeostasis protein
MDFFTGLEPSLYFRAFNEVPCQIEAYHTLLEFKQNMRRVLTSGGEANCEAGKNNLNKLVELSQRYEGPKILPGAGLFGSNFKSIHQTVGADQYHFGKAVRKE